MARNFRSRAQKLVERAKQSLTSDDDDDLLLAALKLRQALEALTYDKAASYSDELGPEEMKTWQPRLLLSRILEVDPHADKQVTLSAGIEDVPGQPSKNMKYMGTENPLSLGTLKKHYDALGSYLHTPTLGQLEEAGEHDFVNLRKRCLNLVAVVEETLSSTLWNMTIDNRGEIECFECGKLIRRRLGLDKAPREVFCWNCSASYLLQEVDEGKVQFTPIYIHVGCPQPECGHQNTTWKRGFGIGSRIRCGECGTILEIAYSVRSVTENSDG